MHHSIRSHEEEEKHQLLISLKQTVEGLLANCSSNVWNTYGGLSRLCTVVESILSHKLNYDCPNKDNGYWNFLSGLQFLKPSLIPVFSESVCNKNEILAKGQQWIKDSLQQHIFSSQLEILTQNKNHLFLHYDKEAFLCDINYTKSLLICLKAVEENQVALLAKLDPNLLVKKAVEPFHLKLVCSKVKDGSENFSNLYSSHSEYPKKFLNNSRNRKKTIESSAAMKVEFCDLPNFRDDSNRINKCNEHILNTNKDIITSLKNIDMSFSERLINNKNNSQTMKLFKEDKKNNTNVNCNNLNNNLNPLDSDIKLLKSDKKYNNKCKYCCNNVYFISSSCPDLKSYLSISDEINYTGANKFNTWSYDSFQSCQLNFKKLNRFTENDVKNICAKCRRYKKKQYRLLMIQEEATKFFSKELMHNSDLSDSHRNDLSNVIKSTWKPQHIRSRSDIPYVSYHSKEADDSVEEASTISSLPSSLPSQFEIKNKRRRSLLEDGSHIRVPTECFFPQPHEGQSLTSFLSSKDFGTCAELDKENAHFCISEALISAIEQIKCNQLLKQVEEEDDDSDEEIQKLKQHIRIRRRQRQQEKLRIKNLTLLSDGKTDTTTTSASPMSSVCSFTASCEDSSGTEDDIDELELTDTTESKLSSLQKNGLSLSLASLYSDADIQRVNFNLQNSNIEQPAKVINTADSVNGHLSAESVALNLLKKFSEKQLPKASDLQWLVSERDAPQTLLPLPDSWPVSPDIVEEEYSTEKTRLRGNLEWAPPRAQIIFSIHSEPIRKVLIAKQNYRCAGCGTKINQGLISKFRYCEYLGKYFCHCCHNNSVAYIPGRILYKWDFSKYYVSKFSYDLLDRMYADPLFNLMDINSSLYKKIRQLNLVREYRTRMFFLKDFIRTCRESKSLQDDINQYPAHIFSDPQVYSLQDLIFIKNGELPQQLYQLVNKCISHIKNCTLCKAKGFICEICNKENIIFPFELFSVIQCQVCWACFHRNCYIPDKCPKCIRIEMRKRRTKEDDDIIKS